MRRSRYWRTLSSVLLVLSALSGAIGCSQGAADKNKNASATPAKAVETQASPPQAASEPQAQIAAQLGSPSATTSIPGNQLPPPDPKFGGTIALKASTRTPVSLIEFHYDCPFKFTGKINRLTYDLGPHEYVAEKPGETPK